MSKKEASEAGKALSKLGASKGGKARAESLKPEQRSDIAKKAAGARWSLPEAIFDGDIKIGNLEIPCAVLEDGTRVLTQAGFLTAIGRSRSPKAKTGVMKTAVDEPPTFLAARNLKPFLNKDLLKSTTPVKYRDSKGRVLFGYDAKALPSVCRVFIEADEEKALRHNQVHVAKACRLIVMALATVGIVALVDEATGYEKYRDKNALHKILEAYIAKELLPWTKRFPDEFYEEMFRLRGWSFDPETGKKPVLCGKLTNRVVYEKLPVGVMEQLRKENPKNKNGNRLRKHHQFLTQEVGHPHLEKHLSVCTALMRATDDWKTFLRLLDRAVPTGDRQNELFNKDDER